MLTGDLYLEIVSGCVAVSCTLNERETFDQ